MGYIDYSMSEGAAAARTCGLLPSGECAKALRSQFPGITAAVVREVLPRSSWHHTSKMYNQTNFYSTDDVEEYADKLRAAIKRHREAKAVVYDDCTVKWLEWYGTRSHPRATECSAQHAQVVVKGQTATITLEDGTTFVKRLQTRGFWYYGKKRVVQEPDDELVMAQ